MDRLSMKFVVILSMLMAFNAYANEPPKADKKPERSAVPEKITRPKATPDTLPHPIDKSTHGDACSKFEYKEQSSKIVCLLKPAGADKPKPAAH
jgi:hypothetical protein